VTVDPFNPMDLCGRRILVTGASSGIGRATAALLSKLGAQLICIGRNRDRLQQSVASLTGAGHGMRIYDLNDLSGILPLMVSIAESFGPLHGLVHAAGLQDLTPLRMLKPEQWQCLFRANVESALMLTHAFQDRRVYAGSHGAIVYISSIMGQVGAPGRTAYSLSKGALDAMARSLALELAPKCIRVNCVAPAMVLTPIFEESARHWTAEQRAKIEASHPLGFGKPDDVANAVAFLLADTARWITGSILVVDGGYTAQ
jgi:NAD(P)-dependent dehydrogenase (short-subunit alcohol dehydrogenase family)